jgi:Domain of unknown function (DUF4190)
MTSFGPPDPRPPVPAEDPPLPVTAVPTPPLAYPEYAGYAPPQGYAAPATGYAGYPPGYPGYPGYSGYPALTYQRRTNGLAIAAMTTSIVGIPLLSCYGIGVFVSLAGAIMGHIARRQVREREEDGGGMALAGIIVGWIGVGLSLLVVAGLVFFFVAMANGSR